MVHPDDSAKPVLVTGATSYIGSHIIKLLLARNHVVRATARDPATPTLHPLRKLDPSGTRLSIVHADMNKPETFPPAVAGCRALIHVAAPVVFPADGNVPFSTLEQAHEKQIRPAVEGTQQLFQAAAAAGVHKIVLTSSIAAMISVPEPHPVLNEACWSDETFSRDNIMSYGGGSYMLAKFLQEKIAWKEAKRLNMDLVCINPAFVCGPSILGTLNASLELFVSMSKGQGAGAERCKPGTIPDAYFSIVDVREVAMAHVLALEDDTAEGRYLLLSHSVHFREISKALRKTEAFARLPELPVDTKDDSTVAEPTKFDNSKVRGLGVTEIAWEDSIHETAKSLAAAGHV